MLVLPIASISFNEILDIERLGVSNAVNNSLIKLRQVEKWKEKLQQKEGAS